MKGDENPLSAVMRKAQELIEEREAKLFASYGIPLFVTEGGDKALLEWPADPDLMTPEEMQVLIDTRGEEAVNQWLGEFYQAKADRDQLEGA
jgi:hypothetical protein